MVAGPLRPKDDGRGTRHYVLYIFDIVVAFVAGRTCTNRYSFLKGIVAPALKKALVCDMV